LILFIEMCDSVRAAIRGHAVARRYDDAGGENFWSKATQTVWSNGLQSNVAEVLLFGCDWPCAEVHEPWMQSELGAHSQASGSRKYESIV
jgi:hypothetical protein